MSGACAHRPVDTPRVALPSARTLTSAPAMSSATVAAASSESEMSAQVRDPSGVRTARNAFSGKPSRLNAVVQDSTVPTPSHSTIAVRVGSRSTAV